ncbi:class I adenylate-forming enzyme family protein [Rubrobacter calidifluminis]|uniref:class I adenylate-forming enzyme family protein n=1 Tax=Rubrobacter calidifluminis TaxID=1392640 RepID=UPI002362A49F|nr:AMP-binding protein [Rubrobacter calidifluminis]
MILRDMLERAASRYPESLAVVDGERRYTYAEWNERVDSVACALRGLGVRKGDRVVQLLKNREENCAVHMACQKLGAINTPLNFRWAEEEVRYCLGDASPRVVLFEEATREVVLRAREGLGFEPVLLYVGEDPPEDALSFDEVIGAASGERPEENIEEEDIALMLYTSGTTGRPKGVLRSQRAEYAATVGQVIHHGYSLWERTLGCMPLYHTMGMHSLTSMISLNGLFVAMPDWDAGEALEIIERERISALYLIPTLFHDLVGSPGFDEHDTTSVKKLSYAGAPMLGPLVERCLESFDPEVFVNHYGSTEVYIFAVYPEPRKKPGCAGRAAFHTEIRVVRADPEPNVRPDEVVPQGETGEIIVRLCDDAYSGYYNRPEATARTIREGWHFTGDTGYIDEDGDLWVTGRVDDMIITGGENVYPVEVEEVISRHPGVEEVAVVGLPDERWGQAVTAFIVPAGEDLTPQEIDEHCRKSPSLARFKRPKRIVLVKELPKSPVGKLLRRRLLAGEYEELKTTDRDEGSRV